MKVVLDNTKRLYELTKEESNEIKKQLTFNNPDYEQAKKYSRYKNIRISKYLFMYEQFSDYLEVPIGFKLNDYNFYEEDVRKEVNVLYPPFKLKLRHTQKEAFNHYIENPNNGLIVMPTGKGKSILGLYLAFRLKQKTLIIVHKDDLVDGWTQDSKLCFGETFSPGLIKAKKRKIGEQITIATVQTLNRFSKTELNDLVHEFGLIVMDEAHHVPASSYDLIHDFSAPYKVGLTATPERTDGLEQLMYLHFGDISYRCEITEDDEDILPVKVIIKNSKVFYMPTIKINGVEIPITMLPYRERPRIHFSEIDDFVVKNKEYLEMVTNDIIEQHKLGRSIVIFLSLKEHCRFYFETLKDLGITEEKMQLYYGDSKENKSVMKKRAENKEVDITIATYSIATEGTNVKAWEVAFLVSSINNEKNTEQAVGRIRRNKSGKIKPVLVFDYSHPEVYTFSNHIYTRKRRYSKLKFKIEEEGKRYLRIK